jgi:hypothetical protein
MQRYMHWAIRTNADAVLGAAGLLMSGRDGGLGLFHCRLEPERALDVPGVHEEVFFLTGD